MDYVHRCAMCDWERSGASPTVTSPRCDNCGCPLEAVHTSDLPALAGPVKGIALPDGVRTAFVRFSTIAAVVVLVLAAALTGYTEGGPAMAIAAIGVAGLCVVSAMTAKHA